MGVGVVLMQPPPSNGLVGLGIGLKLRLNIKSI